jgi:hypothetical protein
LYKLIEGGDLCLYQGLDVKRDGDKGGRYVFVKVALDDAPAVFLADDAFLFLGSQIVVLTPVCHREDSQLAEAV